MQRAASAHQSTPHKILPVVTRVIEQLDTLFVEMSGKAGTPEAIFEEWLSTGKIAPSGLRYYVYALELQFDNPTKRNEFSSRAERVLQHLQSGYVS